MTSGSKIFSSPDDSLLPQGEKAGLIAAICALHLAALVGFVSFADPVAVLSPLNVDLVAKGDYFVDTIAVAGPPSEKISPTPPEPDPKPEPQPTPPAPPTAAEPPPDAPQKVESSPVETPPAVDAAAELAAQREKAEKRQQHLLEKRREAREEQKRREKREAHSQPQGGSEARRAGVQNGAASAGARANYGAIVAAELNRHKFYPPAARAAGETGSVGVTFVIGPSGRVVSHAITSSSGSAALDAAVRNMMASAHAPPPPGGSFRGSININFNLGR